MKLLFSITIILLSTIVRAQNSPSELISKIFSAIEGKRYNEIGNYVWHKANSEEIIKQFKAGDEKFGPVNYRLKVDSVYRQSKSEPKKYYQLNYNFYYSVDLVRYEFIIVKEKNNFKLASVLSNPYKGNYNDPLMNKGVVSIASMFVDYLNTGNYEKAYNLFSPSLQEVSDLAEFKDIAETVVNAMGGIEGYSIVDTCTSLNYYGENESYGLCALKLKGKKLDLVMNLTIDMHNDVTFFISRYQVIENAQINNLNEIKATEKLIDDFYYAYYNGAYEKVYDLLHPDLRAVKSYESITTLLSDMKTVSGAHKSHSIVSQIFSRNVRASDLNRFMAVVKNENQNRMFYDNFMFTYDGDNNLKIIYFYFVEY